MRTSESDTGVLRRTEKPNRKELGIRLVKWEFEDRRILNLCMHAYDLIKICKVHRT